MPDKPPLSNEVETELLPCPFCGLSEEHPPEILNEYWSPDRTVWLVKCGCCEMKTQDYTAREYAVEAWNTRTSADDSRVERLTAQLQGVMNCLAESQQEVERLRVTSADIRRLALEEAAKVCDQHQTNQASRSMSDLAEQARQDAAAIRALIPSIPQPDPRAANDKSPSGQLWRYNPKEKR